MEGGAANIVTIVLPYTDRLYRASPTPQQRNKKWPYEAGQKISFPFATSDMEMAFEPVAIHEALLNEDGFYNSTNYDNPAGAGMGIGFGTSPFAGGMHPPWFEDRSDQFDETQEQWIKRWIVGSMNKPIDGIRNGGRFQVNEEQEIMNEGIKDFMKRRSAIAILDEPLYKIVKVPEDIISDLTAALKEYGFKPFNRMTVRDLFKQIILNFLERNPDGLAELSPTDFDRVYPNDEERLIPSLFNSIVTNRNLQILVDDIKFGRLEFWFERIVGREFSGSNKTKYEHSYSSIEKPKPEDSENVETSTKIEEIDSQLNENLSSWLIKNSSMDKAEIDSITSEFNVTCLELIKTVLRGLNSHQHLIAKFRIQEDEQQLEKNTEILDEIFGKKYINSLIAEAINEIIKKSEYALQLFEGLRYDSDIWKSFEEKFLNEGIGDFVGKIAHGVADKAKGAVDIALTKHSTNKKFKLPLRTVVNFESEETQRDVEQKAAAIFAKYSFVPYPMSTVGQFYGRIIADLKTDINKLAYPDKPETFEKTYPADEENVIFSIFSNLLENNPDLEKITIDIGHGNLEKWWRTIFGVRAENEPGEPAIDIPDDKAIAKAGGEKIIDDKLMAFFDSTFSGSDMASRKLQLKLLSDPKMEKQLAAYLTIQKEKAEEEQERFEISRGQDTENLGIWARPKNNNLKIEQGVFKEAFQKASNSPRMVGYIWNGIKLACDEKGWSDIKERIIQYWAPYKKGEGPTNENVKIQNTRILTEAETVIATVGGFEVNQGSVHKYISNLDKIAAENNIMIMCRMQKKEIINATNFRDLAALIINIMSSGSQKTVPESQPQEQQPQEQQAQKSQTKKQQPQGQATAQQPKAQSQKFMSKVAGASPKTQTQAVPKTSPSRDASGRFTKKQ